VTPERVIENGWVLVESGAIGSVGETKPTDAVALETGGVILPGLIDMHGHPEWNIFPAWEPPQLYPDRYAWQASADFQALIHQPMHTITKGFSDTPFLALLARYAEVRALVGGTTAVQGSSGDYPSPDQALVRHVDLAPFGRGNAAALIFPLDPGYESERRTISQGIDAGRVTAFYAHLAEGVDTAAAEELDRLIAVELLKPATVIIHGTGLSEAQLRQVHDAGAKLVWSPQSNLRLYGRTTLAATARSLGIPVALGADWLPSGSVSLLAELQVARRVLAEQGDPIAPADLLAMVTTDAAKIADLDDNLGRLDAGRPADLLVLERRNQDAYESILQSDRASVQLVTVSGHLLYGRDDWFRTLAPNSGLHDRQHPNATGELVWAWGQQMRLDIAVPAEPAPSAPALPGLQALRTQLLARYRGVGPVLA
jgi:imidazolonepropionase-like amidohydrolase